MVAGPHDSGTKEAEIGLSLGISKHIAPENEL